MGRMDCDHIERLITLASDNIKQLSLYYHITKYSWRHFERYPKKLFTRLNYNVTWKSRWTKHYPDWWKKSPSQLNAFFSFSTVPSSPPKTSRSQFDHFIFYGNSSLKSWTIFLVINIMQFCKECFVHLEQN